MVFGVSLWWRSQRSLSVSLLIKWTLKLTWFAAAVLLFPELTQLIGKLNPFQVLPHIEQANRNDWSALWFSDMKFWTIWFDEASLTSPQYVWEQCEEFMEVSSTHAPTAKWHCWPLLPWWQHSSNKLLTAQFYLPTNNPKIFIPCSRKTYSLTTKETLL